MAEHLIVRSLEKMKRVLLKIDFLKMMLTLSFVIWTLILYFNPYYPADLENHYTDHLRNFYYTSP